MITLYYFIEGLGDGDHCVRFFTTSEKRNAYRQAFEDADKDEYIGGTGDISLSVTDNQISVSSETLDPEPRTFNW